MSDNKNEIAVMKRESDGIMAMFKGRQMDFAECLPPGMDVGRLIREAMTCINRNPTLLKCTKSSLILSLFDAAQLGLYPSSILNYAHLVPFWSNKEKSFECKLIPGYKGLCELARRSGKVIDIYSALVYENEVLEMEWGLDRKLVHKPLPPNERGIKIIGGYAVAKMKDGDPAWTWMWFDEIDRIGKKMIEKCKGSTPWNEPDNWPEMAKKTVIKRLSKMLPLSPEFDSAASLDEDPDVRHHIDLTIPEKARKELVQSEPGTETESKPETKNEQNSLESGVKSSGIQTEIASENGQVITIDPETGEVKSVSNPNFKPLTISEIGTTPLEFKKLCGQNKIKDPNVALKLWNDNGGDMVLIKVAIDQMATGE